MTDSMSLWQGVRTLIKMGTKICKTCKVEKDISEFSKATGTKDGHRGSCKQCEYEKSKKYANTCICCGDEFKTHKATQKYCSTTCEGKYIKDNNLKKGEGHWNWSGGVKKSKCDYCGREIQQKIGQFAKFEYHYCSKECNGKHSKELGRFKGANSTSYNPNLSDEDRVRRRKTPESKQWTKKVYERDNYTCRICSYRGKGLVAHHLNGYNLYKDGRTDVNNGVTLCKKHHNKFHGEFGYGNNTKLQFDDFLVSYFIGKEAPLDDKIPVGL